MYGHVIKVPTHLNVKLPAIGGHLPNADADSHLLVVRTCYNGQCKQMPRFGWSFQPIIAHGTHPTCDRQFVQMSMLPSGDRKQYFISRVLRDEPHDCGPRSCRRERILVLTNAHHVERLPSSWCGKTQINSTYRSKQSGHKEPSWPSGIRVAGLI